MNATLRMTAEEIRDIDRRIEENRAWLAARPFNPDWLPNQKQAWQDRVNSIGMWIARSQRA